METMEVREDIKLLVERIHRACDFDLAASERAVLVINVPNPVQRACEGFGRSLGSVGEHLPACWMR